MALSILELSITTLIPKPSLVPEPPIGSSPSSVAIKVSPALNVVYDLGKPIVFKKSF